MNKIPCLPAKQELLKIFEAFCNQTNAKYFDYFTAPRMFKVDKKIKPNTALKVIDLLLKSHITLNCTYKLENGNWEQVVNNFSASQILKIKELSGEMCSLEGIAEILSPYLKNCEISNGPLWSMILNAYLKSLR